MTEPAPLPLAYPDISLDRMEAMLRRDYLRTSGWLESAERRLPVRDGQPLPWFTYGAIDFLSRAITPDLSVFEYGGGNSTLWWSGQVRHVSTVEHDRDFTRYLTEQTPTNLDIRCLEDGAEIPVSLQDMAAAAPQLHEPERTPKALRSGQINLGFEAYALSLLNPIEPPHDIVVIDGMARNLCTWAAIQHFRRRGFIVFDNSDRDTYQTAYDMLADSGYRRIDFWGLGPINPYGWCTSVFYQPSHFSGTRWFEPPRAPTAPEPGTGILVIGFNRPHHLQAVLESLRLQGKIGDAHVWIDGGQNRAEFGKLSQQCTQIASRYAVREVRALSGHLGIEKLMLTALDRMSAKYARVLILEDDCFPLEGAVDAMERELDVVAAQSDVFSVYGCHFGTEPQDSSDFSRFQGWGWAAHSHRIREILPELKRLFDLDEDEYLSETERRLTPEIRARLLRTGARDVTQVLSRHFSWDSATALVTAERRLLHRRTEQPVIVNDGITKGIGHFHVDRPALREAPFNMVCLDEVWSRWDRTSTPCSGDRASYGLDGLDRIILDSLPAEPGVFVEVGAYDGVAQSNSVLLEQAGWRGLMVEANPGSYARCVRRRPKMTVIHAACVAKEPADGHTTITDVGLMSLTADSTLHGPRREEWLERGEGFAKRARQDIEVPAATLDSLLAKHGLEAFDLLLLDVEGAELAVLQGLDLTRYRPRWIVAEDTYDDEVADYLRQRGYDEARLLLERKFTRDRLYERRAG